MIGGEGVEASVDGTYFGGYVKPANHKASRRDLRKAENQTGKRQVGCHARARRPGTPFVVRSEAAGAAVVARRVAPGSTIYADEASRYDSLHSRFLTKRVNHSEAYSADGACTNWAEEAFSRLRRAEIDVFHHIAGP